MVNIVDRRLKPGDRTRSSNRQKFLRYAKYRLAKQVASAIGKLPIREVGKKDLPVSVDDWGDETSITNNHRLTEHLTSGNDRYRKGDRIKIYANGGSPGNGGGDEEDSFSFTLTKQEFMDIYFDSLELPNFVKKSLARSKDTQLRRAGYTKDGIPPQMDLKKTYAQYFARKIATGEDTPMDDIDMVYRLYTKQEIPIRQAAVFFLMDKSGSVGEREKAVAKNFFLLLFIFLEKCYDEVLIHFVSYTSTAIEESEEEFFYGKVTGGTNVSSGLSLVSAIIDREYGDGNTNVYVAHASDGDIGFEEEASIIEEMNKLLLKTQYFAYLEVYSEEPSRTDTELSNIMSRWEDKDNFGRAVAFGKFGAYKALSKLFKRKLV